MTDSGNGELVRQDEAIYAAWETGKGLRALSREFALSVVEIERALDRMLPVFDAQNQLRAFKRELRRLEDLSGDFYSIARQDPAKNTECAHLVARLNERICAMRGWSPMNIRIGVDPTAVEAQTQPSSYARITEVLMNLKHSRSNGGDGAVSSDDPNRSDNAVAALSISDGTKPSP